MAIPYTRIMLLPGLDGTGRLFKPFIKAAPPHLSPIPVALPPDLLSYGELANRIAATLPNDRFVLIAESYSGPLALAIA
jgi:hypothetical protein